MLQYPLFIRELKKSPIYLPPSGSKSCWHANHESINVLCKFDHQSSLNKECVFVMRLWLFPLKVFLKNYFLGFVLSVIFPWAVILPWSQLIVSWFFITTKGRIFTPADILEIWEFEKLTLTESIPHFLTKSTIYETWSWDTCRFSILKLVNLALQLPAGHDKFLECWSSKFLAKWQVWIKCLMNSSKDLALSLSILYLVAHNGHW